ncbi:hydrophobe/amphiphile efflux-3 (HAE3) family protein [Haladaptatus litoreus]|uniref:Hydrophobe/amphiphile efflux-3 (HAE3) family protein n=1 Tax=Haladaptatus litoreus TaxID=553468 RepID=A0A1N6XR96_9EURY|nr:MMPL family transporter [Haladaptatus litoreus]SIR04739.1 hydrophobe/amphiphile efflux-3 (HAE3) family protein [Haladaptatus litoreus]
MSLLTRLFENVTSHSRVVIAVLLVLTVLVGAGAPMIEQSSSLDQFQSDSEAAEKLEYIETNFTTGQENTTAVQVIVRGDNVLSKDAMVNSLQFQQQLRENQTVNKTLVDDNPTSGVANVVAIGAIQQEKGAELRADGEQLRQRSQELNQTAGRLSDALNQTRALQAQYDQLNASRQAGDIDNETYRQQAGEIETQLQGVQSNATSDLTANQSATFNQSAQQARGLQAQLGQLNASYQQGQINQSTYQERTSEIQSQFQQVYQLGTQGVLAEEYEQLQTRSENLTERQEALQNGSMPSLSEQIQKLESMNESQVDTMTETVLSSDSGSGGMSGQALAFMPTSYDPGTTEANATMLLVFQKQESQSMQPGQGSDGIVESQSAIQSIAGDAFDQEAMVFGSGIISEEINQSMTDSLTIVGPLALLFVVLTLLVAYRDLLDILLGVFGIVLVLVWTFGFMGWLGITFNQMFIAVPVLLIGLSIDYAIHVFMRHREEREQDTGVGVRGSMRVALVSVGAALTWVTATTVIGFLSNLVSPLPPIQDFGIVSSIGIVAALLIFGALIPALKVEVDEFFESRGYNRNKRAFGTGGGALGRVLSAGAVAARKAPLVVIVLTVLVSAGGAYGATKVDTSFAQEDFLAEDPPGWTKELPEPFKPAEYSAKKNLDYVNDNFVREDSQAQILIQGDITRDDSLEQVQQAREEAAEKDTTIVLASGEPEVTSPLSVMEQVAAENESFNATFTAADTDGNGVPDQNIEQVYDELFAVAPDQAAGVIHEEDGEYQAVRMTVSVKGGAASADVTEDMRDVADGFDNLEATATGQAIVFEIVQKQLLDTVIQSLIITMVSVFAFLMLIYRITEGSATLGAVTLLPVVFSVTWILGTMYLLEMPFNVLTGMITSLTVGLGVAYSIHLSERYNVELERRGSVWEAMNVALTGTGGALLGSAATTVGGFGVLVFAILPALQQFGIITGLTIIYAFLASVLVLPSLLVVWTRYFGPGARGTMQTKPTAAPSSED